MKAASSPSTPDPIDLPIKKDIDSLTEDEEEEEKVPLKPQPPVPNPPPKISEFSLRQPARRNTRKKPTIIIRKEKSNKPNFYSMNTFGEG